MNLLEDVKNFGTSEEFSGTNPTFPCKFTYEEFLYSLIFYTGPRGSCILFLRVARDLSPSRRVSCGSRQYLFIL